MTFLLVLYNEKKVLYYIVLSSLNQEAIYGNGIRVDQGNDLMYQLFELQICSDHFRIHFEQSES